MDLRVVYAVFAALALGVLVGGTSQWQAHQGTALPPVVFSPPFHPDEAAEDLNREYISVRNAGKAPVDLSGWTLSNQSGDTFSFPGGFVLPAGHLVTVHSGCGEADGSTLYWCAGKPVWNNITDKASLRTPEGVRVAQYSYDQDRPPRKVGCSACGSTP